MIQRKKLPFNFLGIHEKGFGKFDNYSRGHCREMGTI